MLPGAAKHSTGWTMDHSALTAQHQRMHRLLALMGALAQQPLAALPGGPLQAVICTGLETPLSWAAVKHCGRPYLLPLPGAPCPS